MTKVTPLDTAYDPHSPETGVLLEVRELEVEFRMRSGTVKASNKVSYHRRRDPLPGQGRAQDGGEGAAPDKG
jgi:hypothetical protein